MQILNRQNANIPAAYPERILQFGGGNFLRGFADWMVDVLNEKTYRPTKIKTLANDYQLDKLLATHIDYYRKLPATLKREFRERTLKTARRFSWIAGDKQTITEEMQLLVSASAVQLLFGLPKNKLGHYDTIILYNEHYLNRITNRLHKGEVNHRTIVLSYAHFLEGYAIPDDRLNLGLHEMAHALDLSSFLSYGKRYFMRCLMENFMNKTHEEYLELQQHGNGFLREYGTHNLREFFAVAVEHFFEAPIEMSQRMPNLYRELCLVLNQDPASNIFRGISKERLKPASNYLEQDIDDGQAAITQTSYSESIFWPPFGLGAVMFLLMLVYLSDGGISTPQFLFVCAGVFLIFAYRLVKKRVRKIKTNNQFFIVKSPFRRNSYAISLSYIVLVAVETNPTYYQFYVTFFEKGNVTDVDFRAYIKKESFDELTKFLVNAGVSLNIDGKIVGKR